MISTNLVCIVGVRFKRAGKVYYFDPGDLELIRGDQVLVETSSGLSFGDVVVEPREIPEEDVVQPIRKVVRKVGRDDYEQLVANRDDERAAYDIALERIESHGLPMRLVNAEYTFDRNRLTFFFTADNRVDFRALVHDLARRFGVRIELRQIGVRDEAKEVGGIGVCGRELCCTSWMGEFSPVSIRMAKQQNLSLNPSKLTGQCGRLKCCLKFENDTYRHIRSLLPEQGDAVAVAVAPSAVGLEEDPGEHTLRPAAGGDGGIGAVARGGRHDGPGIAAFYPGKGAPSWTSLVQRPDPSHVVVRGTVREVLVTWESVDVNIGEGKRIRVSLKQFEKGEAAALSGKLAKKRPLAAVDTEERPEAGAVATDRVDRADRAETPSAVDLEEETTGGADVTTSGPDGKSVQRAERTGASGARQSRKSGSGRQPKGGAAGSAPKGGEGRRGRRRRPHRRRPPRGPAAEG